MVGWLRSFQLGRHHRRYLRFVASRHCRVWWRRRSKRVILPGGLGCITHKLVEVLLPKYKDRMLGEATVVAVVPGDDSVCVTYFHAGELTTVSAKAVIMCAEKHITSRLVSGYPSEQKTAMRRTRYAPYPVVNAIFDKPVYNRGYDTWCPGNSFTDFIVADWTIRNSPGYHQKHNILTFYTPLRETQRSTLLEEDNCKKSLASRARPIFRNCFPNSTLTPSKSASTAAATPCSWPFPASSLKTASPPRIPWTASTSATTIPAAPNRSPAKPSASRKAVSNGPKWSWQASPAQKTSPKKSSTLTNFSDVKVTMNVEIYLMMA